MISLGYVLRRTIHYGAIPNQTLAGIWIIMCRVQQQNNQCGRDVGDKKLMDIIRIMKY